MPRPPEGNPRPGDSRPALRDPFPPVSRSVPPVPRSKCHLRRSFFALQDQTPRCKDRFPRPKIEFPRPRDRFPGSGGLDWRKFDDVSQSLEPQICADFRKQRQGERACSALSAKRRRCRAASTLISVDERRLARINHPRRNPRHESQRARCDNTEFTEPRHPALLRGLCVWALCPL